MKMVFELNNCCFCIGLKAGSLIIANLSLFAYLLMALLILFDDDTERVMKMIRGDLAVDADPIASVTILGVLFAIGIVFTILLLVGLHQNKRGFVLAYLIFATVGLTITSLVYLIGMIVTATVLWEKIIDILLQIYCLLVIRSHYLKMSSTTHAQMITDYSKPKEQSFTYKV